jgi:hypothetical protein
MVKAKATSKKEVVTAVADADAALIDENVAAQQPPPPPPAPEGVFPFHMSMTQAEGIGFKQETKQHNDVATNQDEDEVDIDMMALMKLFSKNYVVDEIDQMGFMSAFHPCGDILSNKETCATTLKEIAVVSDPSAKYGELYLLLHTIDSIRAYKLQAGAKEKARLEREAAELAANEAAEAEFKARKRAVYVEKEYVARQGADAFVSPTAAQTETEVNELMMMDMNLQTEQEQIRVKVTPTPTPTDSSTGSIKARSSSSAPFVDVSFSMSSVVDTSIVTPTITGKATERHSVNDADTENNDKGASPSPSPSPSWIHRLEMDKSVQAAPTYTSSDAQTDYHRKVNKTCQYETLAWNDFSDDRPFNDDSGSDNANHNHNHSSLVQFLHKVLPHVELALQKNEMFDILSSPTGNGDGMLGDTNGTAATAGGGLLLDGEDYFKPLRSFCDLRYMKGNDISCVAWMPSAGGRGRGASSSSPSVSVIAEEETKIAAAICESLSYEDRSARSAESWTYYVVVWKFSDWVKPDQVLACSHMCRTLHFCPTNPNLLVAGCEGGEMVMWDLSAAAAGAGAVVPSDKEQKEETQKLLPKEAAVIPATQTQTSLEGEDDVPIWPCASSHVDFHHRVTVSDIVWLPPSVQMNSKGQLITNEHLSSESHTNSFQFLTCAEDDVFVWDIRYQDIIDGKLPHVARGSHNHQQSKKKKEEENSNSNSSNESTKEDEQLNKWTPVFCLKVERLDGRRTRSIECLIWPWTMAASSSSSSPSTSPFTQSTLCFSTNEGFLAMIDCMPPKSLVSSADDEEAVVRKKKTESASLINTVPDQPFTFHWAVEDHFNRILSLDQSPLLPHLVVSVCCWGAHVWDIESLKHESDSVRDNGGEHQEHEHEPLFSSPHPMSNLTLGRWCPTRAGLLCLAKEDGTLDVWDFSEPGFPMTTYKIAPSCIISMSFIPPPPSSSSSGTAASAPLLAVGDGSGCLHILELAKALAWPTSINEAENVAKHLHRSQKQKAKGAGSLSNRHRRGGGKHQTDNNNDLTEEDMAANSDDEEEKKKKKEGEGEDSDIDSADDGSAASGKGDDDDAISVVAEGDDDEHHFTADDDDHQRGEEEQDGVDGEVDEDLEREYQELEAKFKEELQTF